MAPDMSEARAQRGIRGRQDERAKRRRADEERQMGEENERCGAKEQTQSAVRRARKVELASRAYDVYGESAVGERCLEKSIRSKDGDCRDSRRFVTD